jgi:2,3-bisphosphoglycerate-independent phosphoglycerate mutase
VWCFYKKFKYKLSIFALIFENKYIPNKPMNKKLLLLILDGWGLGAVPSADAIAAANTPFMDSLYQKYPHSTLTTFGYDVGLPDGQMGNSEVGHTNIGAGRVVYQELARINKAAETNELAENQGVQDLIAYAKTHQKPVHLLGLVSDGGVHSHITHLKALVTILENAGVENVFIHAFTDGRDTDPQSGALFLDDLQAFLQQKTTRIASLIGRYYAMDRDKRWERVQEAYDLLVHGVAPIVERIGYNATNDFAQYLRDCYKHGITDEFVKGVVAIDTDGPPLATIKDGDAVLFFNFRTDRPRELTQVLTQDLPNENYINQPKNLYFATMTRYDESFKGIKVLFEKDDISQTLGEVLAAAGKTQIRIAETEKYPHVTFFFNGGRETPFQGESRIMIPSPKVATYDLQPEMSAKGITDAILVALRNENPDFVCLNYANTDMVGHTGVWSAALKAAETVDGCLAQLVPEALALDYTMLIIADHGNSDFLLNEDGSPNTAHTTNPVPFILVGNDFVKTVASEINKIGLKNGKLADLAPTILHLLNVPIPAAMTGDILTVSA